MKYKTVVSFGGFKTEDEANEYAAKLVGPVFVHVILPPVTSRDLAPLSYSIIGKPCVEIFASVLAEPPEPFDLDQMCKDAERRLRKFIRDAAEEAKVEIIAEFSLLRIRMEEWRQMTDWRSPRHDDMMDALRYMGVSGSAYNGLLNTCSTHGGAGGGGFAANPSFVGYLTGAGL